MTPAQRLAEAVRCADRAHALLEEVEAMPTDDARGMSERIAQLQANAAVAQALVATIRAAAR